MEIHALAARGWTKAAIARHTGRDRKTVSKYLARPGGERRERAPSCLEPFRGYLEARFADDPHVDATVLFRELVDAGFDRSYPTLVRELRRLGLRPVCLVCQHRRGRAPTVEIEHPAGEEIQWDWLELPVTPKQQERPDERPGHALSAGPRAPAHPRAARRRRPARAGPGSRPIGTGPATRVPTRDAHRRGCRARGAPARRPAAVRRSSPPAKRSSSSTSPPSPASIAG